MEILKLTLRIAETSKIEEKKIEVIKETPKTYKIKNGVIAKSKLMETDSIFRNTIYNETPSISYYTYCLLNQKNDAINLLIEVSRSRIRKLCIGANNLQNALSDFKL